MQLAKRKYVGYVASKVPSKIYEDCLEEYINPYEQYEKKEIVPNNALRQKQYNYEN